MAEYSEVSKRHRSSTLEPWGDREEEGGATMEQTGKGEMEREPCSRPDKEDYMCVYT